MLRTKILRKFLIGIYSINIIRRSDKKKSKGVQQMCKVVEEYGDESAAKAAQQ